MAARAWIAAAAATTAVAAVAVGPRLARPADNAYVVRLLVADRPASALHRDRGLVNAWGLAASPTGPWWTANEARDSSTLYAGTGAKQALTVEVGGGPTGVVYNGTKGFVVRAGRASGPARFLYAAEDGTIRGWSPTVPGGWSTEAVVAVDEGAKAAVFRGLALAAPSHGPARLYATDFHNGRVEVFDARWRPVRLPRAFVDRAVPSWYAPFGIQAIGGSVFVTYNYRAPVNGNDAPTGGYVDEFDLDGKLVARVGRMGPLNAPWGIARAQAGFGRFGGDLLVGDFGDGRVNAFREHAGHRWTYAGSLRDAAGKPLAINGLWGIAFGNGGMAGPRDTLFFASGPHRWLGATESEVHGLLGAVVVR
jgi:uncharacterized protein (TIGR03118 family)